jgi:hypothetical protein
MKRRLILIGCSLLALAWGVTGLAQTQARGDRVFIHDLEGIWMNEAYLKELRESRMPHQSAKKQRPVVIAIKREGRVYPFVSTDFQKAALMVVLDVEPDLEPGSYRLVLGNKNEPTSSEEAKYVWFKGARNADNRFDKLAIKELFIMKGKWADYERVGLELGPAVNSIVLTGNYKDRKGREWSFTDKGKASFPDKTFYYELSLNDKSAKCEYFEAEDMEAADGTRLYGYRWKRGELQLYDASVRKDRVRCEPTPFAFLKPNQ